MERVTYLGFVISRDGVEPGSKKLEGIKNFPRPRDVHQVRRFLGLASYFRRFVPRFAERASALTTLLKKDRKYEWGEREERAFVDLKEALGRSPVLQMYNPERRTELHTDASSIGLAAMLLQERDDGQMGLVYAISR